MDALHVATLNILNLDDRWPERPPLILADIASLQHHLLGLHEVVYPMQQDRLIGAAGAGHHAAIKGWAGRPECGNSLLVRKPLVGVQLERLDLGLGRSALRASSASCRDRTSSCRMPIRPRRSPGSTGRCASPLDVSPMPSSLPSPNMRNATSSRRSTNRFGHRWFRCGSSDSRF